MPEYLGAFWLYPFLNITLAVRFEVKKLEKKAREECKVNLHDYFYCLNQDFQDLRIFRINFPDDLVKIKKALANLTPNL
ncbi:MAG: hypothetical protein DRR19_17340 [Candidatus Parabeggiatoa sp. nov. 1]|nr:MAG: hypothetical protein DRR19_17340 [Gammaproteobacteria bacterium]